MATGAGPAGVADPTRAPVPPAGPYRSAWAEADYAKAYPMALQDLGPPPEPDAPTDGVQILDLIPDSPAAKAGLEVGDTIIGFDGKPVPTSEDLTRLRQAATQPTDATIEWPTGERSTVRLPVGKLGVKTTSWWLLDADYARHLPMGVFPSEPVRVAVWKTWADPTLATAALAHAPAGPQTAGPVVQYIAARIAEADCRYDDALAYAVSARRGLPPQRQPVVDDLIGRMARLTFRWHLPEATLDEPLKHHLVDWDARPHKNPVVEPTAAADGPGFADRTKHLTNLAPDFNLERPMSDFTVRQIRDHGSCRFDAEEGKVLVHGSRPGRGGRGLRRPGPFQADG